MLKYVSGIQRKITNPNPILEPNDVLPGRSLLVFDLRTMTENCYVVRTLANNHLILCMYKPLVALIIFWLVD